MIWQPTSSPRWLGPSSRSHPGGNGRSSTVSAAASFPKESIREIRINQNPFSPEYDKLGYGKIEIFTAGFRQVSWDRAMELRQRLWNTRNPYSPDKAPFLLNEFEGNAGGPLTRNRPSRSMRSATW
jgi:hypothetical protein